MANEQHLRNLIAELEAADLIIEQLEEECRKAHLDRSFTLRREPRRELIASAKARLS